MQSRLQSEIRQSKPFESRAQEAILSTLKTADELRRALAQEVQVEGLTLQQYNVLRILRGAGEQGLPTLEIAARMIEQAPGITRFLDQLEKGRLIRRERSRADRRCVLCYITPVGMESLNRLDEPVRRWNRQKLETISDERLQDLITTLEDIRSAVSGDL